MILTAFKPYGMTPKELVDEYKKKYGFDKGAFSGRLDPMACGITKIYLGDKCSMAHISNKLGKTYRFIMVLGIGSTSYDLLGFPTVSNENPIGFDASVIKVGNVVQNQPIHSSFMVSNKEGIRNPLWWWALHNRIEEVNVPSFNRILYKYEILREFTMTFGDIRNIAKERIGLINSKHNFNQKEILEAWEKVVCTTHYTAIEIKVDVSSGFYIRQLVHDIGKAHGTDAITIEIERLGYEGDEKN